MEFNNELKQACEAMAQGIQHLKTEFSNLAAGKASVSMVDNLMIESYGAKMPLKSVATITTPEQNQILIQPWDKSQVHAIEQAISNSDTGLNAVNEGQNIRIVIPKPTEEKRLELVKMAHNKAEEAKVTVRNVRQQLHNDVKAAKDSSDITEDDFYDYNDRLDKETANYNAEVDELMKKKEAELMTI